MAACSVGSNGRLLLKRAILLACVFVSPSTDCFSFEDTYSGVSSEQFEAFLRTKGVAAPTVKRDLDENPSRQIDSVGPGIEQTPQNQMQLEPSISPAPNIASDLSRRLGDTSTTSPTTSQPGVELYQPDDNETLQAFAWDGCWWEQPHALTKQLITPDPVRVQLTDLEQLVWLSLQHSPAIKAILKVPEIQRAEIDVAKGEFDPRFNARTNFRDTSDPVGNTLVTGGPNRLNEYFWENSVGISDRNTFGGRTELRQAIDARDNNSLFFIPSDQIDTKLSINYTQPLRRGYGTFYNTSQIQIQQTKTQQEIATANEALQNHAMKLHNAYWTLVVARYQFVQTLNTQYRLEDIHRMMSNRRGIDLIDSQMKRVEKEVETLKGVIANLKAKIKSTQFEIAQLVAAPELQSDQCGEIIPLTIPTSGLPPTDELIDEYYSAILYRGDLARTRLRIEQVAIQKKVAIHELQSKLDLFLESYVRGLEGNSQVFRSLTRQFDSGSPSYAAGLVYEIPRGNRAARANVLSNTESLAQQTLEYDDLLQRAYAQVNSAIERSKGSYQAIFAKLNAAEAAKAEVELHQSRFDDYFSENASRSIILSEWLDAEMRLFNAERDLAEQQVEHMRNLTQIKFESGTLLTIQAER
ncbi:TolC family protein [Pirellulaceae bacterium SH449]